MSISSSQVTSSVFSVLSVTSPVSISNLTVVSSFNSSNPVALVMENGAVLNVDGISVISAPFLGTAGSSALNVAALGTSASASTLKLAHIFISDISLNWGMEVTVAMNHGVDLQVQDSSFISGAGMHITGVDHFSL